MAEPHEVFRVDREAVLKGGSMAGQYLDEIGKTDLATLSAAEWEAFCFKLVGYTFMAAANPPLNMTPPF